MDFTELRHLAEQIETECGKAIIGKGEQIRLVLTSLFAGGHVLIDDIPGVGKTTLVKALSAVLGCGMVRVQFTPDLLPSDIVGMNIYSQKTGEMVFTPGPIMTNILLADEINRAIPRTQSALLEAMEERQVSVDGVTYPLAPPFMVLATQNPVETETTFALPAAQLDRFLFKLSMGYPTPREEAAMLRTVGDGAAFADLRPLLSPEEVNRFTREIRQVRLSDPVVAYIVELVQATREQPELACGASPRVSRDLFRASKAYAALSGRDYVTPDDVKYLARYVLPHRVLLSHQAALSGLMGQQYPVGQDVAGTAVPSGGALRPGGGRRGGDRTGPGALPGDRGGPCPWPERLSPLQWTSPSPACSRGASPSWPWQPAEWASA